MRSAVTTGAAVRWASAAGPSSARHCSPSTAWACAESAAEAAAGRVADDRARPPGAGDGAQGQVDDGGEQLLLRGLTVQRRRVVRVCWGP